MKFRHLFSDKELRREFFGEYWVAIDRWYGVLFSGFIGLSMMIYGMFSIPSVIGGFLAFLTVTAYAGQRHFAGRVWAYQDIQGIMRGEEPRMSRKKPVLENPPPGDDWIADD